MARRKLWGIGRAGRAQRGFVLGRKAFLKLPGTVTVEIGAPIDSRAHTPESLNAAVEEWIEGRMAKLCPGV